MDVQFVEDALVSNYQLENQLVVIVHAEDAALQDAEMIARVVTNAAIAVILLVTVVVDAVAGNIRFVLYISGLIRA
jgi:hypothetical protein